MIILEVRSESVSKVMFAENVFFLMDVLLEMLNNIRIDAPYCASEKCKSMFTAFTDVTVGLSEKFTR